MGFFISLRFKILYMDNIILHAHRGFAYLVLLLVAVFFITLLVTMFGYSGKVSKLLRKSTLFTMIFFHVQFLVGLGMLFIYSDVFGTIKAIGMGEVMKNPTLRFSYIEHPFSMLVAAVLMTIVNKQMKANDTITLKIVGLSTLAVVLFLYAFPFAKLFGS